MSTPSEELSALISTAATTASDEAQDAPALPPQPQPHRCDILLVDDTGTCRELLAAILRNFAGPLALREARNGIEALQLWRDLHPRITLLDINMPGEDGLAVLQEMRRLRPDTFVAMVSASSSMDNVKRALALGASGYVIKPYKPRRILDLLARYTEQTGHTFS
jgi:CheY-like chemotaxis protein